MAINRELIEYWESVSYDRMIVTRLIYSFSLSMFCVIKCFYHCSHITYVYLRLSWSMNG